MKIIICKSDAEFFAADAPPGSVYLTGWHGQSGRLLVRLPTNETAAIKVRGKGTPAQDRTWEIEKGVVDGVVQPDLTLAGIIDCLGGSNWHGYIKDGELHTAKTII